MFKTSVFYENRKTLQRKLAKIAESCDHKIDPLTISPYLFAQIIYFPLDITSCIKTLSIYEAEWWESSESITSLG
jgi:hypothetical protein